LTSPFGEKVSSLTKTQMIIASFLVLEIASRPQMQSNAGRWGIRGNQAATCFRGVSTERLASHKTHGDAIKIELYVPPAMPMISENAKP
jgi:hypothetical protein